MRARPAIGQPQQRRDDPLIGAALAEKYGFDASEAVHAVRRLLIEEYEN